MRVRMNAQGGIERIERWQDTFMDALDKVGVVVDREAYWKVPPKKTSSVGARVKKTLLQEAN